MHKIKSLADELNSWYKTKCEDGNLSWTNLHKSTGVSIPYIVKLAQGKGNPSYEKEKALLRETCSDTVAIYKYLKAKHPTSVSSLEEFLKEENPKLINDQSVNTAETESLHRIYQLSSTGTYSVKYIVELLGKSALRQISYLEKNRVVEVRKGFLHRNKEFKNTFVNDISAIIRILTHNLSILETKSILCRNDEENEFNSAHNKIGGFAKDLNTEGIDLFINDLHEFFKIEFEKLNDKKYSGNVPVYFNYLVGRFDEQ